MSPPRYSERGKSLRGASGRPGRVAGRGAPKISALRSKSQTPPGRRNGYAIVLVGGGGVWPPRDSKWGKTSRGFLGRSGRVAGKGPPKISAHRSGCQTHPGPRCGCAIVLVGGGRVWPPWDSGFGKALRGALGCQGVVVRRAPPKNSAHESGGQMRPGRHDECAITLVEGSKAWPPRGSEWGKAL